ncbi:hypothetical protein AHMF7605_26205 [Adhaeribacter arboris]|uniref:Tyr recombinase domain-containing protein n=1 Tax=Adhaeribacter arboris TaxID=2072846 RepID=A0A2T2YML0_9BACT|nr:tyrosine-type recombinase/integrase [Adhaeribacter arboris]PSR56739.1 hypothetical protein AHMF7605_26205 [Adhaeribacter arboris]
MEINRYPRKDRIDKEGKAPIRIMVHYYNKRLPIPTGEKVLYPDGWDEEKQKVKHRQPFASVINQKLANIEKTIQFVFKVSNDCRIELTNANFKLLYEKVYAEILASGTSEIQDDFTNLQLQQAYESYQLSLQGAMLVVKPEPDPKPTLIALMHLWVNEEKERIVEATGRVMSPNTIKGLNSTVKRFIAFEQFRSEPLTLEGMDKHFYAAFREYMLKELKQGVNNFGKHVRRLKQFLSWCEDHDEELKINPKYVRFSAPSRYRGVDFLLLDELIAIEKLDFNSESLRSKLYFSYSNKLNEELEQAAFELYTFQLELARDIFLMCCYTGLRISDAQRLAHSDIKKELIIIDTQKTGEYCYIPFFDDAIFKPVAMVHRYRSSDRLVFPKCPKINHHLKLIQKLAGIDRIVLSTKVGRKTFATTKVYQGVPRHLVMQATGHKTEASFNRYIGIDEQELISIFKQQSQRAS